jgi:hypothetical protein
VLSAGVVLVKTSVVEASVLVAVSTEVAVVSEEGGWTPTPLLGVAEGTDGSGAVGADEGGGGPSLVAGVATGVSVDEVGISGTGIIAILSEEVEEAGGVEVAGVSTGPEVGAETGVERTGGTQETTVTGPGSDCELVCLYCCATGRLTSTSDQHLVSEVVDHISWDTALCAVCQFQRHVST